MLHLVQSSEGFVTPAGIEACAEILGLTAAEVSAVATFYTMYKRRPIGDYHVGVCTNTLCAVMGGDVIFERLKSHLDVGNDETTTDGKVTLEHVECNAACDYAPVVMVNWEFFDNQTPQSATDLVDDLRGGREVTSTRGARRLHLARGRAGARRVPRRPRRRGSGRRTGDARRARAGAGEPAGRRRPRPSTLAARTGATAGRTSTMQAVQESTTQRAESETIADQDTGAAEVAGQDGPPKSDQGKDPR